MVLDHSGRGPTARQLGLSGIAVLTTLALLVGVLALRYVGYFESRVPVEATLTSTGDGLPDRADVKFRGMVVGVVSAVEVVAAGQQQRVDIDLKPDIAETIPNNVTARVIPNNLFGVTAIELVDNGDNRAEAATSAGLSEGVSIPEDTSAGTVQLQTTLTVLRDVLDNIQPEKLGRVLATLSEALDPAARVPGSTIDRLDNWLTEVHRIDGVGNLLGDLGQATTALSQSAPELVGVLAESVTAARTLTERRENLVALLSNSGRAVDAVNNLFARNPDAAKELVPGLDGLLGSLAADRDAMPYAAANLNEALAKLQTVFGFGPSKQMVWKMDVTFTPFQQYTAEDCPRYGDMAGPRCGSASVPQEPVPQEYPPELAPGWLPDAGQPPLPAPASPLPAPGVSPGPAEPVAPNLPFIPNLPRLPNLSPIPGIVGPTEPAPRAAPASAGPDSGASTQDSPAAADIAAPVANLRGHAAVAALVGAKPTATQLLLLTPLLAGGSVEVYDEERS